jgi:hypothetical protein
MQHEQDVIDQLAAYFAWLQTQLDAPPVVAANPFTSRQRHQRTRLITTSALVVAAAGLLCVVVVSRVSRHSGASLITPNTQFSTAPTNAGAATTTEVQSTPSGAQSTTTAVPVLSGLVESEAIFPEDLIAAPPGYQALVHRGVQAAVLSCMTDAGFKYRVAPDDPIGTPKPHILDATYRQQYGYGYPPTPSADDPYWAWLRAEDAVAGFHAALYGSDPNAQMGGCTKTAYFQIYFPDGVAVAPRNDEFNIARNDWFRSTLTPGAVAQNPTLAAAAMNWSSCMSEHGITATTPDELAVTMNNKRPINTPPTSNEIETALTDWNCQHSTDFLARWYGTVQASTRQFAQEHADLINSINTWTEAVGVRSQAAIDSMK